VAYWNDNGSPQPTHDALAIVDCTITNASSHLVFASSTKMAILGSAFDTSKDSHVLRLSYVGKGVVSNNHVRGAAPTLHELKLHAPDYGAEGVGQGKYSEQVVISDNRFESVQTTWSVALAPQSGNADERIRDVILERNHFLAGPSTAILVDLSASATTLRNNIFDLSGGKGAIGIKVAPRGVEPKPDRTVIANNTFYRSDSSALVGIELSQDTANSSVHNNLAYAPSSGNASVFNAGGTGNSASNNVLSETLVFVSPSPSAPSDYRLIAGTAAIDGGVVVPGVFYDFELKTSPADGDGDGSPEPDLGAFEHD
jgi:hypothetical protein